MPKTVDELQVGDEVQAIVLPRKPKGTVVAKTPMATAAAGWWTQYRVQFPDGSARGFLAEQLKLVTRPPSSRVHRA